MPLIEDGGDDAPARVTFLAFAEPRPGAEGAGDCALVLSVCGELVAGSECEGALVRWAEQGVDALAADLGAAHP